jgi:hypothetical protein
MSAQFDGTGENISTPELAILNGKRAFSGFRMARPRGDKKAIVKIGHTK